MLFKDFEDYLSQVFAQGDGSHCLDDNFPEAFDEWLQELQADDWLSYGNKYAQLRDWRSNAKLP